MHEGELVPVGEHQTFILEKDRIYDIIRPFPNAWHARVQANVDVWYRMDGGEPGESKGFLVPKNCCDCYMIINNNWKLMTVLPNGVLQVQWLGINGSLE